MRFALVALLLSGCVELGVVDDGTSVSLGRASHGGLRRGAKLPDEGQGYVVPARWKTRGNRYGTDEVVVLVQGVAKRLRAGKKDARLVVADLGPKGGGEGGSAFHRSHQSGRDVDLIYYERDAGGAPVEADQMRIFDAHLRAKDESGVTIDVPRTWRLVRELVEAPEAPVQWIFMYEPIAAALIAHAEQIGEPPERIARVRATLHQPGDSARHDDHLHVRVYCSAADRACGCEDSGPMDRLALREADAALAGARLGALLELGSLHAHLRTLR